LREIVGFELAQRQSIICRLNPCARCSRFRVSRAPSNHEKAISTDRGDFKMPFVAYDSDSLRLLSWALADAMISARETIGQLSEAEGSELNKRLVRGLADAHDSGERDHRALKRAALRELFATHAAS
jgi:hypothetical protein